MADMHNIHLRKGGILNLISQREQGILSTSLYKTNVTDIKVSRLPKISKYPNTYDVHDFCGDEFFWCSLRSGVSRDLIGVGNNMRRGYNSVCTFQFMTGSSVGEENEKNFINEISNKCSYFKDMTIIDTADLCYCNRNPLIIVGKLNKRRSKAVLTSHDFEWAHPDYEWRFDDPIFCCASTKNSVNFALGCKNGFYVCKDIRIGDKYRLEDDICAIEFNDDGNLLLLSSTTSGIQLCDMRENIKQLRRNTQLYHKESAMNDSLFIAYKMKLLSDQITLIVSDKTGHVSKVDLRMKKSVFQYSEHMSYQKTRPLNIDEDLDLLCAVGYDSCCRLWSLNSGKLHWAAKISNKDVMRMLVYTDHACIVSSGRRWFVAVVENNTVTPIVPGEVEVKVLKPEVIWV